MSTRPRSPLNERTIAFLFRYVFTMEQVEVREYKAPDGAVLSVAAFFDGEAAPRYEAETYSDLWDLALTDRIQAKLNEHSTS